jgi:hypothetical protein
MDFDQGDAGDREEWKQAEWFHKRTCLVQKIAEWAAGALIDNPDEAHGFFR